MHGQKHIKFIIFNINFLFVLLCELFINGLSCITLILSGLSITRAWKIGTETADEVSKCVAVNNVSHSHKFVTVFTDDAPST